MMQWFYKLTLSPSEPSPSVLPPVVLPPVVLPPVVLPPEVCSPSVEESPPAELSPEVFCFLLAAFLCSLLHSFIRHANRS